MKKILKQDINSIQRQNIVPISNLKARKIKTLLSLPIHLAHHRIAAAAVAPLLLRCRSADAAVSPAVALDIAPAVDLMLLLLLLCCLSLCCSLVALLSLLYRSDIAQLSLRFLSAVTPLPLLSLLCRYCCYAVTLSIDPAVTPLSLLLLFYC